MTNSLLDERYFGNAFGLTNSEAHTKNSDNHFFQKLCHDKLDEIGLDPIGLVNANKFISLIEKTNEKFPFVSLPNFVSDFLNGMFSRKLITKYNLRSYDDLTYIVDKILKLPSSRNKSPKETSLVENLQDPKMKNVYDFIISQSNKFQDILGELLHYNILRSIVAFYIIEKKNLSQSEIIENIETITTMFKYQTNLLDIPKFLTSFTDYLKTNLSAKVESIIDYFSSLNYLKKEYSSNLLIIDSKYDQLQPLIFSIIDKFPSGISHTNLHKKILKELPLFQFLPNIGIWEDSLNNMEKEGRLIRRLAYWRYSPFLDQIFTRNNYETLVESIRKQIVQSGRTKFFGRRINPEKFVDDLEFIEKGDFNYPDDQVTRIAGLVLANSANLKAPTENVKGFDFAVDINNYSFQKEQIEAMKKIDFTITANIIQCLVMINEVIDEKSIERIKSMLPTNQQAVIFSFRDPTTKVKERLKTDKTVQIIGKDGLLLWTQITPVVPCRSGSLVKIMYGDLHGEIARVNSINYESGIASITTILNYESHSVYVGSLQEIWFGDTPDEKFYEYQNNYEEFLDFLQKNAKDIAAFKSIFNEPVRSVKVNVFLRYSDKIIATETIDPIKEQSVSIVHPSPKSERRYEWLFEISGNKPKLTYDIIRNNVSLPLRHTTKNSITEFLSCDCLFYKEQSHNIKLCSHLMIAMNFFATRMNQFGPLWKNDLKNIMHVMMLDFEKLNKRTIIEYVSGWFNGEKFENFIQILKNLKCEDDPGDVNIVDNLQSLKKDLIDEFNSDELSHSFDDMVNTVSTMRQLAIRSIISDLETKNLAEERRRKM